MEPSDPYLDSATLASLRAFIALRPVFQQIAGTIAKFTVVLDANIAVNDLIHKYKYPHVGLTALEEAVKATVLEVHAPRHLDREMDESTIRKTAKKRRVPEAALRELWIEYRKMILWHDEELVFDATGFDNVDEKDIPYVALERAIDAAGVLSRDKDIVELGGTPIGIEFVLSARTYARAASYAISIRVHGAWVANISFGLLAQLAKAIGASIARMPPAVKIVLLAGAVFVAVHPRARDRAWSFLSSAGSLLAE